MKSDVPGSPDYMYKAKLRLEISKEVIEERSVNGTLICIHRVITDTYDAV